MRTLRQIHTLSVTSSNVGCYCVSIFKLTYFLSVLWLNKGEEGSSAILLVFNQQCCYQWNSSEWGHYEKRVNGLFRFHSQSYCHFERVITNPRNIVYWEETKTDFSGWIVNPSSRNTATAALIILKQISKSLPGIVCHQHILRTNVPLTLDICKWRSQNICKDC